MTIPDAAVEAAARAAYEQGFLRHVRRTHLGLTWDDISEEARESWRQVVLAAAPHIAAQALRDAADLVLISLVPRGASPRGYVAEVLIARADQIEAEQR